MELRAPAQQVRNLLNHCADRRTPHRGASGAAC